MPCLYALLQVKRNATATELRRAFLILAKKCHPDKLQDDDGGEAFRTLRKAYDILIDPQRRARYDRTGVVDEQESVNFADAYERFRGVKVTKEDIDQMEREYRESDAEKQDLRSFFEERRGNVRNVLAFVLLSRDEDIPRFVQFWQQELKAGRLTKSFAKEFARAKKEITSLAQLEEQEELEEEEEEEDDEREDADSFIASEDEVSNEEEEEEDQDEDGHSMQFTPGDLVQGRWKRAKKWYDAYVLAVDSKEGTYDLEYVQDKVKEFGLPTEFVRAVKAKPEVIAQNAAEEDLYAAIQNKAKSRQANFDKFAAKYTKRSKRG